MVSFPTSIRIVGSWRLVWEGGYVRRCRRFLPRGKASSWSDDNGDARSSESERKLAAGESSMAGVQKNSDGLANGSKNLAGSENIFDRMWRMESSVRLSCDPAPDATGRSVLRRCEGEGPLASVSSSKGNIDVQSAIGLPNTAALIPCTSAWHSVKASIAARLPPMNSPQMPNLRAWLSWELSLDEVAPWPKWLLIQS